MKKTTKLIAVFLATFFAFVSCNKENDQLAEIKSETSQSNQDSTEIIKTALQKLGFSGNKFEMDGEYIRVDGDILISKPLLFQKSTPRHATTYFTTKLGRNDIKVHIGSEFTSSERLEIEEAFNEYLFSNINDYGAGFTSITFTSDPSSYDIRVYGRTDMPSNVCGQATFPTEIVESVDWGGGPGYYYYVKVGNKIDLNLNLYRSTLGLASQRKLVTVHEIGHTLGLRHTNWQELGEPQNSGSVGAYTIMMFGIDYTAPDPFSVFNGQNCGAVYEGFTDRDKRALSVIINNGTPM